MIVVVEGPSAAGKTTWCAAHGPDHVVAETGPIEPPGTASDDDLARFWGEIGCGRWAEALRVEAERGLAVCDTDPLKLHHDDGLARLGLVPWDRFDAGVRWAAEAVAARRLGLADVVLVAVPDDGTLARRRDGDPTRTRRRFDLHRRLGPALRDWYATLDGLDPGRVGWEHPPELPPPVGRERYDADLFRAWMDRLPRPSG